MEDWNPESRSVEPPQADFDLPILDRNLLRILSLVLGTFSVSWPEGSPELVLDLWILVSELETLAFD